MYNVNFNDNIENGKYWTYAKHDVFLGNGLDDILCVVKLVDVS